jgi:hypothetical protein
LHNARAARHLDTRRSARLRLRLRLGRRAALGLSASWIAGWLALGIAAPAIAEERVAGERAAVAACSPTLPESHMLCMEVVHRAGRETYARILRRYDAHLASDPGDVRAAAERCRLIEAAAYDEYNTFDVPPGAADDCAQQLAERFPEAIEVWLLRADRAYGEAAADLIDELLARGGDTLAEADRVALLRRAARALEVHRAPTTAEERTRSARAGRYAAQADALAPSTEMARLHAQSLRETNPAEAVRILERTLAAGASPEEQGQIGQLLLGLEQYALALATLDALPEVERPYVDPLLIARAHEASGRIAQAREAFDRAASQSWRAREVARERFRLELRRGTAEQARASYEALRDLGWAADPFVRHRLDLLLAHPWLPLTLRDAGGVAALCGLLVALSLVAACLVMPFHYFGLWRGRASRTDFEGAVRFGLQHVFFVVTAILAFDVVLTYLINYPEIEAWFDDSGTSYVSPRPAMALHALLGSIATGVAVLALLRPRDVAALRGSWGIARAGLAGAGCYSVVLAVGVLNLALVRGVAEPATLWAGSFTTHDVVLAVLSEYGAAAFAWVVMIAAPLFEELWFREIWLRALSRYLRFGFANLTQASIFAALHMEPERFLVLLAVGLLAGELRRRSGGLVAPIALHATNNVVAGLLLANGVAA